MGHLQLCDLRISQLRDSVPPYSTALSDALKVTACNSDCGHVE